MCCQFDPTPLRPSMTGSEFFEDDDPDVAHLKTCFVVFDSQSQGNNCVKAMRSTGEIRALTKYEFQKYVKRMLTAKMKGEKFEILPSTPRASLEVGSPDSRGRSNSAGDGNNLVNGVSDRFNRMNLDNRNSRLPPSRWGGQQNSFPGRNIGQSNYRPRSNTMPHNNGYYQPHYRSRGPSRIRTGSRFARPAAEPYAPPRFRSTSGIGGYSHTPQGYYSNPNRRRAPSRRSWAQTARGPPGNDSQGFDWVRNQAALRSFIPPDASEEEVEKMHLMRAHPDIRPRSSSAYAPPDMRVEAGGDIGYERPVKSRDPNEWFSRQRVPDYRHGQKPATNLPRQRSTSSPVAPIRAYRTRNSYAAIAATPARKYSQNRPPPGFEQHYATPPQSPPRGSTAY